MFPNRAKVRHRASGQVWLVPVLALALVLLLTGLFAFSSAQAQTVSGDLCIEGIVIDHEEEPLAGWAITLTDEFGNFITSTVSAEEPDEDDKDPDFEEGEFEFEDLQLGTYILTIESRDGWEGVTPTSFSVDVEAGRDDCLRVRFKMRRIVEVTVYKIDADHNPLPNWEIEAIPGPGNFFAIPKRETTNITGFVVFTLTPGVWIFTERAPDPEDLGDEPPDPFVPVLPPGGKHQLDVQDIGPNDPPYIVVFKNEFRNNGCVIIRKFGVVPEEAPFASPIPNSMNLGYGAGGWGFRILRDDGSIARQGVTDAEGFLKFENLPYGPYTIVEEDRPGWNELTPRELDINVTSGDCILVPFENEQDESGFCIEGYKLDVHGGYGIAGWKFEVDAVFKGGPEAIEDEVYTDGTGKFRFDFPRDDYRTPGGLVEVCEDDDVDGWVPHTPYCQRVELPKWPSACVQLEPFVNAQVGHKESHKFDKDHDGKDGKDGHGYGGPSKGGPDYAKCRQVHEVKKGEGLFAIGESYKVSPQAMLDANSWVREVKDYVLHPGQKVCIP